MHRFFAILLCTLILIPAALPLNAAAETSVAITADGAVSAATSTTVFDGFNITILDKTIPAANIRGRADDRNVMSFVSADDREIGVISHGDYNAIVQQNRKVVYLPGGGYYGTPPVDGKSWEEWFADEFNAYRGLEVGSREMAVELHIVETVEQYRQEVIALVNDERENAGLPALYADDAAMEYAQERAQELVTSYSHTRPDNKEKPYDELGAINENIARGQWSPQEVVEDWMNSPGHRSNILNDDAFAIGVGCYSTGRSFYWSQEFLW